MKDIVIVGAGGFGKEVAWMAKRCGRHVKGFLDSTPEKLNTQIIGLEVLGPIDNALNYIDCEFIIAIGNPRSRKKIIDEVFNNRNFKFATLIDPQSVVGDGVIIKEGTLICAGGILTIDIEIGKHSIINLNSTIGHDVIVKDFVTIAPNASISGNIILGDCVEIGTNAAIREKIIVEDGAVVGMGAVVTKNVEEKQVVVGNPAKLLKIIN